jgi:cold shock CspA family protein
MDKDHLQIIGRPRKSEMCGFGTVKFFAPDPAKGFGFMSSEFGDVFFHSSRCYELADNGTDLPGLRQAERTVEGTLINAPRRNDQILFVAENGDKGLRAVRWVLWSEDILQTVFDEILERPGYQFIKGDPESIEPGSWKVLWEGRNIDEFRNKYPKFRFPANENHFIRTDQGEPCSDPR